MRRFFSKLLVVVLVLSSFTSTFSTSENKNTKIIVHISGDVDAVQSVEVYYEEEDDPLAATTNPGDSGIYKTPDGGDYALDKIEKIVIIKEDDTFETFYFEDWTNSREGKGSVNIWLTFAEEEGYYSVIFDSAGGTAVSSQSVLEGEKVEEPSDPTRSGYIFDGWTYEGSLYDFDLAVGSNMELLAKWISEEVYYTVTFDSAGGTAVSSQSILEGEKVEEPSDPTRSGYIFDGWTYDGSLYDFDLAVGSNMELLAKWISEEAVYYNVIFDSAGGTAVPTQSVLEGEKVEEPSDPTRSGYIFDGWTYEGSLYDFDLAVGSNMELLAKWISEEAVYYNVIFDSAGGTAVPTQSVLEGGKVEEPSDPTRSGYIFDGWTYDGSLYDFDLAVGSNMELLAKWISEEAVYYNVIFDSAGGTAVSSQSILEGEKVEEPSDPTRSGYIFDGWTYDGSLYDFDLAVGSNMELLAKWISEEAVYYNVIFDSAGGTAVSSQSVLEGGKVEEPSDPTRSGYIFDGWTYDGSLYDFDLAVENNMELLAKWISEEAVYYNVIFDSAGGTAVPTQSVLEGGKVEEPSDPTRSGYIFDGWTYDGSLYDFDLVVGNNMELLAKWISEEAVYYNVIFDSAGGTAVSSQSVLEGGKVEEPSDPTRSGYIFDGWTYDGSLYDFDLAVGNNMELLAKWISDGGGTTTTTRTTTTSSGGNDATIDAERDDLRTVVNEPISVETSDLMANDTDAEEFVSVQDPRNGSVSLSGTTVTFTPETNYVGIAYFYYTIADGDDTDNGLVVVTVEEATEINPEETPLGSGNPNELLVIEPEIIPLGVIDYSMPYIMGYPDNTFRPERQVTRAEMVTIFARILGLDLSNPGEAIYADVNPEEWYYKYVQAVTRVGLFSGYEDNMFKPHRPVTNAEIASAFSEYWDLRGIEVASEGDYYSDISGHWAEDMINRLYNAGISVSYPDGTFKPDRFTTRTEFVVMVNRSLNRLEEFKEVSTFSDVMESHWGFGAIEAATGYQEPESVRLIE